MLINDFLHNSKTQAAARGFGSDIGVEQAVRDFCGNAMATVFNREFQPAAPCGFDQLGYQTDPTFAFESFRDSASISGSEPSSIKSIAIPALSSW